MGRQPGACDSSRLKSCADASGTDASGTDASGAQGGPGRGPEGGPGTGPGVDMRSSVVIAADPVRPASTGGSGPPVCPADERHATERLRPL